MAKVVDRRANTIDRINERLTLGSIVKTVVGVCAILAAVWGLDAHYVTRKEFNIATAWNVYGVRNNRLEFLKDKQYECEQKKLVNTQLDRLDTALCSHFDAQTAQVGAEVQQKRTEAEAAGK